MSLLDDGEQAAKEEDRRLILLCLDIQASYFFTTQPRPLLPLTTLPSPPSPGTPLQYGVVMQWKEMWIAPRSLATSWMLTSSCGRWSSCQLSSALLLCLSPSGKVPLVMSWHEDETLDSDADPPPICFSQRFHVFHVVVLMLPD